MTKKADPKTAAIRSRAAIKAHLTMATSAAQKARDSKSKKKANERVAAIKSRLQAFERANRRHLSTAARA